MKISYYWGRFRDFMDTVIHWRQFHDRKEVRVVPRDRSHLRLSDWRATPDLVKYAQQCMGDPHFQYMLDVLRNEHPSGLVVDPELPMAVRAVWHARAEGYTMALTNLESMSRFEPPAETLEATFEEEETLLDRRHNSTK